MRCMAEIIKIKKVCEWCEEVFYAQKTTTRYCSRQCNSRAYKHNAKEKRIKETEEKTEYIIREKPIKDIRNKDYLSFAEAGLLLGISRQAVYKMVLNGHLTASKISSRLSFIKRSDIESMLTSNTYHITANIEKSLIT